MHFSRGIFILYQPKKKWGSSWVGRILESHSDKIGRLGSRRSTSRSWNRSATRHEPGVTINNLKTYWFGRWRPGRWHFGAIFFFAWGLQPNGSVTESIPRFEIFSYGRRFQARCHSCWTVYATSWSIVSQQRGSWRNDWWTTGKVNQELQWF